MQWPFRFLQSVVVHARRYYWVKGRYAVLIIFSILVVGIQPISLATDLFASTPDRLIQAQSLNQRGQQAFGQGQPQIALSYWEQAEAAYQKAGDVLGLWGSQLNQAKALQTLGFYRRAHTLLSQLHEKLISQPLSLLKVNVWLTHGEGLRLLGDLSTSQLILNQGLAMAQQLGDRAHQQAAHVYLGNAFAVQHQWVNAAEQYKQAIALPGSLQITAQLRQLQTLPHLGQATAIPLQTQILVQRLSQGRLPSSVPSQSPPSPQTQIYLTLELTHWLLDHAPETIEQLGTILDELLYDVIQRSETLGDRRAESYGWGYLGQWYEHQQQWSSAQACTQTALSLAQALNANELVYQWQWQQGRIARSLSQEKNNWGAVSNQNPVAQYAAADDLATGGITNQYTAAGDMANGDMVGDMATGNMAKAIAYYSAAVDTLQTLRQEIVAVTRDVEFSFRDQIEPIYRDLVQLLLTPASLAHNPQAALEQARQVMENLQLAELNNFFREPCLEAIPQSLDTLDTQAAVFYPIILPNQLAVILSIPGQPLSHYAMPLPQAEVEQGIQKMLSSMRLTSFPPERLAASQQLYQWLIQPAEDRLQANGIQTLVFVLDGVLRNLPLAALHNGTHYLSEDYRLAISPGLQLLRVNTPQAPLFTANALAGGLSQGGPERSPLAGVQDEILYIEQLIDTRVLLNEAFTSDSLIDSVQQRSFDIVHLASHAQFGATDAETFIETWDGTLQINQLRQLLNRQDSRGLPTALLVLSACDTAQGDKDAVLGMAGLAVRSGAQSTLATLWSVNDQATLAFTKTFYDGLIQKGFTKAEAIQYAQQKLRQTPLFQHPYYWAPFVLVGDWL